MIVEQVAFANQQFAANDLIARGGVAGKLDATHVELLAFVEIESEIDSLGGVVDVAFRFGGEVDEAELAVELGVVFNGFADLGHAENVALMEREGFLERLALKREPFFRVGTANVELAHAIAVAFFNCDGDVGGLAVLSSHQGPWPWDAGFIDVHGGDHRVRDFHFIVTIGLIEIADADFQVFVERGTIEGLAHHRDIPEVERDAVGPVMFHRAQQTRARKRVVAREGNQTDLDLGSFVDVEGQLDGVRGGDAFVSRFDHGELMPVRREQFLDHHLGLLDLGGIELALHRQSDFAIFEGVQHVGFGDRLQAFVLDAPDDGALGDVEENQLAVRVIGAVLHDEFNVLEIAGVP